MTVQVSFYSYFKDLAGGPSVTESLPAEATIEDLLVRLFARIPRLKAMDRSILVAVGVEYQSRHYPLKDGDEVSLFPPVQGG